MASNLEKYVPKLQELAGEGKTWVEMAQAVNDLENDPNFTTESSVRRLFRRKGLTRAEVTVEEVPSLPSRPLDRAARAVEGEKTDEDRLRDELDAVKADLKQANTVIRKLNEKETVETRIERAISYAIENNPYDQPLKRPAPRDFEATARAHEFVLMMSDAHYGEQVWPEEAFGIKYDTDVARRRIEHMRDVTFRYADLRGEAYDVSKITVAVLGDMLSGYIHEELEVNNQLVMTDQAVDMAYILFNFLNDMAERFEKVDMVIMPGNHPRVKKQPNHKNKFNNWEFMMGKMVEGMLGAAVDGKDEDVRVIVPKNIVYIHDVFDKRIAMQHGDGVNSNSFAGIPFYGMRNRREGIQSLMSQVGQERVDMFMMGHFHQHLYWQGECDILINGSIKGGDEYGISTRLSVVPPIQVLTEWHPEHGLVGQNHITLGHIQ